MSTYVAYDPALFVLERAAAITAALGSFVLGASRLGASSSSWLPVPMASFSCTEDYTPNDLGVLIYGSETAAVSLAYWHTPAQAPLYPGDRVRASYDGQVVFLGTVETTTFSYAVDGEARKHGATHRVDFTAGLVGTYGAALSKQVCWRYLPPTDTPLERIRDRFHVVVTGWTE